MIDFNLKKHLWYQEKESRAREVTGWLKKRRENKKMKALIIRSCPHILKKPHPYLKKAPPISLKVTLVLIKSVPWSLKLNALGLKKPKIKIKKAPLTKKDSSLF